MLFRVLVAVVRPFTNVLLSEMLSEMGCHETVSCWFGINAENIGKASSLAARAAESAVDRGGEFIGGIVVEVHAKCVGEEEFRGYDEYLIQPLSQPGIFYVTGTTSSFCRYGMTTGAEKELSLLNERILSEGIPSASFVHPEPPETNTPSRTRIFCPVCERWTEMDNANLMYSFFDGMDASFPEYEQVSEARLLIAGFINRHSECLKQQSELGALVFLNDLDEDYDSLDQSKRE